MNIPQQGGQLKMLYAVVFVSYRAVSYLISWFWNLTDDYLKFRCWLVIQLQSSFKNTIDIITLDITI